MTWMCYANKGSLLFDLDVCMHFFTHPELATWTTALKNILDDAHLFPMFQGWSSGCNGGQTVFRGKILLNNGHWTASNFQVYKETLLLFKYVRWSNFLYGSILPNLTNLIKWFCISFLGLTAAVVSFVAVPHFISKEDLDSDEPHIHFMNLPTSASVLPL